MFSSLNKGVRGFVAHSCCTTRSCQSTLLLDRLSCLLFLCHLYLHPPSLLQLFAGLHHGASVSNKLPEWPPAGSIGSLGMGMGMSPGHMMMFGTPPLGRSVDMVDVCTQLMEAGGESAAAAAFGGAGLSASVKMQSSWQCTGVLSAIGCCSTCLSNMLSAASALLLFCGLLVYSPHPLLCITACC
jgi:hypothetical protein